MARFMRVLYGFQTTGAFVISKIVVVDIGPYESMVVLKEPCFRMVGGRRSPKFFASKLIFPLACIRNEAPDHLNCVKFWIQCDKPAL